MVRAKKEDINAEEGSRLSSQVETDATIENLNEPVNTEEKEIEAAKEVDEGESAEQLLEQALPYVGGGTPESFVGSPERWKTVKAKIEAFFALKR